MIKKKVIEVRNPEIAERVKRVYKKRVKGEATSLVKTSQNDKPKTEIEKLKKDTGFRLSARSVFLTFPKCEESIDFVTNRLLEKVVKHKIKEFIIVKELHKDGDTHFHVYLKMEKKMEIKNPNFFDINFVREEDGEIIKGSCHGKYERAKKRDDIISYITKDIFTGDQAKDLLRMSDNIKDELNDVYSLVNLDGRMIELAKKGEIDQALYLLAREDEKRFMKEGLKTEATLRWINMRSLGYTLKYDFDSFRLPVGLQKCFNAFEKCIEEKEPKTLVLIGKSGCGKTQLALTYFEQKLDEKSIRVSGFDNLRFLKDELAILFDDFNWKVLDRESILALIDQSAPSTKSDIKHKSVNIQGFVKRCIISNYPLEIENIHFSDPAIARRLIVYNIPDDIILFNDDNEKSVGDIIVENYMAEVEESRRPVFDDVKDLNEVAEMYRKKLPFNNPQVVNDEVRARYLGSKHVVRTSYEAKLAKAIRDEAEVSERLEKEKEIELSRIKKETNILKRKAKLKEVNNRKEIYENIDPIEFGT